MSYANRKKMYEFLKSNQEMGRIPDLSQDDGALEKEFGEKEEIKMEVKNLTSKKKGKK